MLCDINLWEDCELLGVVVQDYLFNLLDFALSLRLRILTIDTLRSLRPKKLFRFRAFFVTMHLFSEQILKVHGSLCYI